MGNRYSGRYEQERDPRYGSQGYRNNETDERRYGSRRTEYDDDYPTGRSRRDYSPYNSNYEQESSRTGGSYGSTYNDRENYRRFEGSGQGRSEVGYTSRGYEGPDYGRGRSSYAGQGAEDFTDWNRRYGRYGGRYPESERGYELGYEDGRGWWDRTSDEVASWFGDEEAARRRELDARREGSYRGRGPSGYVRSDDRITEDINDRLTYNAFIDASNINVEVKDGEVTLLGTVVSRFAKRRAEDISEDVSGVKNVENRLRVSVPGQTTASTGTTTSPELRSSKTA